MRIGVIGYGVVGKALVDSFITDGHDVLINEKVGSPNYTVDSIPEHLWEQFSGKSLMVHTCDIIFICVPTPLNPETRRLDTSTVQEVLSELLKWQMGRDLNTHNYPVIVIKSTVPVGFTEQMQKEAPDLCLAFCPEFLRQKHATEDARNPDRIIIGADNQIAKDALMELFHEYDCPIFCVDTKTAELAKLLSNAYLSTKVAFSQQIKKAVDLFKLGGFPIELLTSDHRIEPSHLDPDKGRIPRDSACLPKDLSELRQSMYYNDFFDVVYVEAVDNGKPKET